MERGGLVRGCSVSIVSGRSYEAGGSSLLTVVV
jgi:hypothetical protein